MESEGEHEEGRRVEECMRRGGEWRGAWGGV